MKQLTQNFKSGELTFQGVSVLRLKPRGILVRNRYFLISTGIEKKRGMLFFKVEIIYPVHANLKSP